MVLRMTTLFSVRFPSLETFHRQECLVGTREKDIITEVSSPDIRLFRESHAREECFGKERLARDVPWKERLCLSFTGHLKTLSVTIQSVVFWILVCGRERASSQTGFPEGKEFCSLCDLLWRVGRALPQEVGQLRGLSQKNDRYNTSMIQFPAFLYPTAGDTKPFPFLLSEKAVKIMKNGGKDLN